ncbi:MAG: D-2-hydroxyacid dehydrogenase [Planctomycetes bacterium]|nr:D-2-hydroxyacid dehydrogenase [Planctomycetota bacterium]
MKVAFFLHSPELLQMNEAQLRRLTSEAPHIEWQLCDNEEQFLSALPDADVAVVYYFKPDWLDRAPKLKLISTPAAGKDWIKADPARVELLFGKFHGRIISETVVGLMMAFVRGIKLSMELQQDNPWPRKQITPLLKTVRGSTALILGFGNIGKWIARLLVPLGVRIIGFNRTDMTRPDFFTPDDAVYPIADVDNWLPQADHLIMALPGGADTNLVMNAERLALLQQGSYIYNIGRGNSLDLDALIQALRNGRLAGAGLDVFPTEPLPADSPVRACPNVILLPHISAFSLSYLDLYLDELFAKLATMER